MTIPLSIRNLTVLGDRKRCLLSVSELSVQPGEAIGIRGPSGAGKSTLLYALAGLQPMTSGSVVWGDTDIASLGEEARADFRRRNVGLVFQDFLLFEELTALENASLAASYGTRANRGKIRLKAADMLMHLGIGAGARRVDSFSGGERQRVAIARALANNPGIILADEPTASLDRDAADRFIEDLVQLARTEGRTLIAVSHDPALLDRMDRVLDVANGALVQEAHSV